MRTILIVAIVLAVIPIPAGALREVVTVDQIAKRQTVEELLNQVSRLQFKRGLLFKKFQDVRMRVDYDPVEVRAINAAAKVIDHQIAGLGEAAVALTLEIYGIAPTDTGRLILERSDYKNSGATYRVLFAKKATHKARNPRTGESEAFSVASPKLLGVTWPDGTISITENALRSPGILAATLVHETVHYDQRTLPHGARVGQLDREVSAFGSALSNDAQLKLGLTKADVDYLKEVHAAFMADPESYFPRSSATVSPLIGAGDPGDETGFGQFGADAEALSRLNDQSSALRRSVEVAAAARSQEFIGRMNEGADVVAAAFRTEAVSRCNLMPVNAESDQYKVRVGRGQPVNLRYADADGFHVAALLAQACTVPWQTAPCNEAMPVLKRRWKDEGFRKSVVPAIGTDERVSHCFWHLVRKLKATDEFQKVREKVAEFEHSNRQERDTPVASPPTAPRPPREGEPRNPAPRPPDYNRCIHDRCIK